MDECPCCNKSDQVIIHDKIRKGGYIVKIVYICGRCKIKFTEDVEIRK